MSTKSSVPVAGVGKWSSSTSDPRVRRVEFLLQLNLARKLRVPELASRTGLSVSGLFYLFKSRTGTTPARYIKSARMEKAKELLERSLLSVKEVAGAGRCGRHEPLRARFRTAVRSGPSTLPAAALGRGRFSRGTAKSANK